MKQIFETELKGFFFYYWRCVSSKYMDLVQKVHSFNMACHHNRVNKLLQYNIILL